VGAVAAMSSNGKPTSPSPLLFWNYLVVSSVFTSGGLWQMDLDC
jgi:hypothetical protein